MTGMCSRCVSLTVHGVVIEKNSCAASSWIPIPLLVLTNILSWLGLWTFGIPVRLLYLPSWYVFYIFILFFSHFTLAHAPRWTVQQSWTKLIYNLPYLFCFHMLWGQLEMNAVSFLMNHETYPGQQLSRIIFKAVYVKTLFLLSKHFT